MSKPVFGLDSLLTDLLDLGKDPKKINFLDLVDEPPKKRVIFARGPQSAGKSTLGRRLKEVLGDKLATVSADYYFRRFVGEYGQYVFNHRLLSAAHAWARLMLVEAILDPQVSYIYVDNTHIDVGSIALYLKVCDVAGCDSMIFDVVTPGSDDLDVLVARNKNGVKREAIETTLANYTKTPCPTLEECRAFDPQSDYMKGQVKGVETFIETHLGHLLTKNE